jgi:uncharacterized membrane protein YfcA
MITSPSLVALVIIVLGLLTGLAKGGLQGLGPLLTPILSLVIPPHLAVGVMLPLLMVGDAFALYAYRGQWDWGIVRRLLPGAIVGALAGTYLLVRLPGGALRIGLALFTLLAVGYKLASSAIQRLRYRPAAWHGPVAGCHTGVASALFNVGGPPFNAYLLLQDTPPRTFVATTALFFALLNLIKLPGFLLTGVLDLPLLASIGWVFLFIPLGILLGRALITRLNQPAFEWLVIGMLVVTSGVLLWQGLG